MGAQVVWRPPLDPGVEIGVLEVANTQGLSWRWVRVPRLEKCGAPHWTAAGSSAAADVPPGTACASSTT